MPNGGTITFSTSKVRGEDAPLHIGQQTQQYLCLRVRDTGIGMDEATRQRMFEPFFTTKPKGKGTGLGMPVVYGLMQSHDGLIDVWSEPGKGTSISLFFPVPKQPLLRQTGHVPYTPQSVEGTETVLIVDDESDVLYFLEIILEAHGYHVLSARNAETALKLIPPPPGEVHLLFSDVGLPVVDGFELNRRARQLQPRLKTILCSGYTDAVLTTQMTEQGIDCFLPKPYSGDALLQTIRSVLDKEPRK